MVLPLWRSLYSLNLMLPKEERRALLIRIFNEDVPLVNTTQKRDAAADASSPEEEAAAVETPLEEQELAVPESVAEAEDAALRRENAAIGDEEQERVDSRETWTRDGDEVDRFNTTV